MEPAQNNNPATIKTVPPPDVPPPTDLSRQQSTISKRLLLGLLVVLFLTLTVGGIYYRSFSQNKKLSSQKPPVTKQEPSKTALIIEPLKDKLSRFAEFKEEQTTIEPAIPAYTLKVNELSNLKALEESTKKMFAVEQLKALANPGFFITPAENKLANGEEDIDFRHGGIVDEFVLHYRDIAGKLAPENRLPENTVFVTSDYLLHVFHVFLDRTFQHVEETQFHPKLLALTSLLFEQSLAEYQQVTKPEIKNSFERLTTFFVVPKVILETSIPQRQERYSETEENDLLSAQNDESVDKPENIIAKLDTYKSRLSETAYQKAKAEIELINEAKDAASSPLFGVYKENQPDDYTQFKPRSHYQKNSVLRSYWKAMIWYGRNGFLTKSDELTLDAINQTILLSSTQKDNQKALTLWENIYLPTVFFVGKSDDLTVYDYQNIINKIYGSNVTPDDLVNKEKLDQFKEEVRNLPGPKIQSSIVMIRKGTTKEETLAETKSFRFFGQRFIPDSFIFSSLTQGDEEADKETGQKLPTIPTALMPMSIFGSTRAQTHLDTWIAQKTPNSNKVIAKEMKKLDDVFGKLETKDWTQNLYWSWLYTLRSLFQTFGEGYPIFMQNIAWNDKDLNGALGSWTELRHDTLLYAKQSYAEQGGGGGGPEPPPVPKGYVEPNLTFLNRIIALAQMTKEGLKNNNIMLVEQEQKLDQLIESFIFYRNIAKKELQNEIISDQEFEKLRVDTTVSINYALTPPSYILAYMKTKEARCGLIADVHTAVTLTTQEILYEATGIPYIIYVAIKDANGARLTRGVIYSYYEFTRPFGERLSDGDWQENIYEGKTSFPIPQVPQFVKALEK